MITEPEASETIGAGRKQAIALPISVARPAIGVNSHAE